MQTNYTFKNGEIVLSSADKARIQVFTLPTEDEKKQIIQQLGVNSNDFDAALDPDEISRIEFENDLLAIIWKQPYTGDFSLKAQFDVLPIGFFVRRDKLIIVIGKDDIPFKNKFFDGVSTINDVLLRYFFYTILQYLSHLKAIKQAKSKLESKLSVSMENKYFLQMFDISESLIYYIDALEANGAVLNKLLINAEKMKFSQKQTEFLEDTIQENIQSAKQAQIYSTVLSGLMDARGNIINNNMNVLLKNLTLINIVFLPLNLIASIAGMSEFGLLIGKYDVSWQTGYLLFTVILAIMGWILWIGLQKYINRPIVYDEPDRI